jgi:hypothetical protein
MTKRKSLPGAAGSSENFEPHFAEIDAPWKSTIDIGSNVIPVGRIVYVGRLPAKWNRSAPIQRSTNCLPERRTSPSSVNSGRASEHGVSRGSKSKSFRSMTKTQPMRFLIRSLRATTAGAGA